MALPNELLYKIITFLMSDCLHTICVSTTETWWEKRVVDTLHDVSPAFHAISSELAAEVFGIPKVVRDDNQRFLPVLRERVVYLSQLNMRSGGPLNSPTTMNTNASLLGSGQSPFIMAYTLYIYALCLRRNARNVPPGPYKSTGKVILAALEQSEKLCELVMPVEITTILRRSIQDEFILAESGLSIVRSSVELKGHAHSVQILQLSKDQLEDGNAPLAVRILVYISIHSSLLEIEAAYEGYIAVSSAEPPLPEQSVHELPGVVAALRLLHVLDFSEGDQYHLGPRITKITAAFSKGCPFLNPLASH